MAMHDGEVIILAGIKCTHIVVRLYLVVNHLAVLDLVSSYFLLSLILSPCLVLRERHPEAWHESGDVVVAVVCAALHELVEVIQVDRNRGERKPTAQVQRRFAKSNSFVAAD